MKKRYILLVIVIILIAGLAYASTFTLKDIEVNDCIMASEDEVRDTITENVIYPNTLILQIQNKIKPIEKPSFVAKMDIDYVSKNKVKVDIYEKSVAGCVEYMENYVYFDKDGVVLETSKNQFDRVPCIRGLKVNRWEMGEKLPIDSKKKFEMILNITQLIDKYDLDIQSIEFTGDGEIVLRHDKIKVELGDGKNLNIQMMNLGSIMDQVKGKSGVLYMKEYSAENSTASFKEN